VSYNIYQFNGFDELLRYIEAQIGTLQDTLQQLEQRYESVKVRAERMKALERVLEDLIGEKLSSLNEIDFMGLKVVVNARAVDELNVLEETIESQKESLEALLRIRDILYKLNSSLSSEEKLSGITILVQTLNEIPVKLLLKETE
jgi:DNA-binding transcriptional regulator YbjK